jgi:hypothetical protein
MSRSSLSSKEIILPSTSPYVDALLTVHYEDLPSTGNSPRKPIISAFKVHRIVLSRLSSFFLNEFKQLEVQNQQDESQPTSNDAEQALWELKIHFKGKKEKSYFSLFPNLLDFLYGKPFLAQEVCLKYW